MLNGGSIRLCPRTLCNLQSLKGSNFCFQFWNTRTCQHNVKTRKFFMLMTTANILYIYIYICKKIYILQQMSNAVRFNSTYQCMAFSQKQFTFAEVYYHICLNNKNVFLKMYVISHIWQKESVQLSALMTMEATNFILHS